MSDTRIVVCFDCQGDGGFEWFTGYFCRHTGAPSTEWVRCTTCDGKGEIEVEVEPIEMADLEAGDE